MSSKRVIILGLLASLLLIFLCIFFNAERYYKELGLGKQSTGGASSMLSTVGENGDVPPKGTDGTPVALVGTEDNGSAIVETKEEDRVETITPEVKEETSTFKYYHEENKTFIFGNVPLLDDGDNFKKFIANCSKDKFCENNVTFLDNEETLSWKDFATSIVTLFEKEHVKNPKLSINKKDITIDGEFIDQSGKDQLLTLLDEHNKSYSIVDNTIITSKDDSTKKDKTPTTITPNDSNSTDENQSTKASAKVSESELSSKQEEISSLLKNNKINFKKNSGKIQKDGKKILDKVVAALSGKENVLIEIQGHTDAGGKEKINLRISQMRADGVKKYLIKKGLNAKNITAKGYGEKKFLLPKKPYSSKNRRVEIYLKRK